VIGLERYSSSKEITVFVAHCSDSEELKDIVFKVIEEINSYLSCFYNLTIKPREWKQNTYAGMGNPEQLILEQMPPDKCNIFVGIFRFKFGAPTGNINKDTGQKYLSGTEEEFCTAYHMWEQYKTPHIMIFKSTEPIPRDYVNEYQIKLIDNYFGEFKPGGRYQGIYKEFDSRECFENEFRKNITLLLTDILNSINIEPMKQNSSLNKYGLERIFTDKCNVERNSLKSEEILKCKNLKLFAKTGFSFLGYNHQFNGNIYDALNNGCFIRVIVLNPWSLNAIYTAFSEEINFGNNNARNVKAFQDLLSDKLDGEQVIKVFENSRWYEKYRMCINGYQDMVNKYRRNIELRLTNLESESSIFITENCCFFEPYLNSMTNVHKNLPIFEVVVNRPNPIYQYIDNYFDAIWKTSYKYSAFSMNEEQYKKQLMNYFNYKIENGNIRD
jgi:hypothetical protein